MTWKKIMILLAMVFAIITVFALVVCFTSLGKAKIQLPVEKVPGDFDWKIYLQNNEDLRRAGINTEAKAIQHWLDSGKKAGRKYRRPVVEPYKILPPDFDWITYVENYKDLQRADIDTKEKAAEHWLMIGRKEGRTYHEIPPEVPDVPYMPWQRNER